jgi:hypothetical protein
LNCGGIRYVGYVVDFFRDDDSLASANGGNVGDAKLLDVVEPVLGALR